MPAVYKKVALLITGDEIVNGDITDSNGHYIAQQLYHKHMINGVRVSCNDEQTALESAIGFLLKNHHALITIGGLGPTSDDRTRFALAAATQLDLIFNDTVWQHIVARLSKHQVAAVDSNKQQALFPQHAHVIPNNNGTAYACELSYRDKLIFMLPGPQQNVYLFLKIGCCHV